jgi:hypothetical protein
MATEIVKRANFPGIVAEKENGIVADFPGQIVADGRYFAVVGNKQPALSPELLDFSGIDIAIEIEGLWQRMARLAGRDNRFDFLSVYAIYHEENRSKTTAQPIIGMYLTIRCPGLQGPNRFLGASVWTAASADDSLHADGSGRYPP